MESSSKEHSLCSSSDGELSWISEIPSPYSSEEASPRNNNYVKPVKIEFSTSNTSSSNSSSSSICSASRDSMFEALLTSDLDSLQQHLISPEKLEQLKQARHEAEESFIALKMSECVVSAIPEAANHCSEELKNSVESVTASSSSRRPKIKSKTGEYFTPLGIISKTGEPENHLSKLEKRIFSLKLKQTVSERVADLKKNSEKVKDEWKNYRRVPKTTGDIVSSAAEEEASLLKNIQQTIKKIEKLIIESQTIMDEFEQLQVQNNNELYAELLSLSYKLIHDKATLLNCKTSILKMNCDMEMFKDLFKIQAMNILGDELKSSIKKLNDEMQLKRKTLEEYELKEQTSKQFQNIVQAYGKCRQKLKHSKNVLEMIQESSKTLNTTK